MPILKKITTINNGRIVVFVSAKSVGGAQKKTKSPLFTRTLKFRGAFPYPVIDKFLIIL